MFNIYLPVAHMSIDIFALIGIGLSAGFLSGLYGIGGGMVTVPIMIFCGVPANIAIVTSFLQIVCLSGANVTRNIFSENMRYKIAFKIGIFSIIGSIVGAQILIAIKDNDNFSSIVSVMYILLMLTLGLITMFDGLRYLYVNGFNSNYRPSVFSDEDFRMKEIEFRKNIAMYNKKIAWIKISNDAKNFFLIAFFGISLGIVSSIMGIGGGFLSLAIIMYFFHENIKVASTTSSLIGVITTLPNTFHHIIQGSGVDPVLAIIVGFIGIFGIKIGAKMNVKMDENLLKFLFGLLLIMLSLKISIDLFTINEFPYLVLINNL